MSLLTKGTEMWVRLHDSAGYSLLKINCPTGITGLGGAKSQIDDTCLDDLEMKYKPGMAQPGALTVNINFDPADASHIALWDAFDSDDILLFIIGAGDGTADPTVNTGSGIVTYPSTRSFISFDGHLADFPVDFALNTVVKTAMSIQRDGPRALHPKS
jgi:hypothetical protein